MICALCREDKTLCNSHIIPEFLYASLYDDKHRFQVLSVIPEHGNSFKQKGLKESLLCESCEQKFSVWEQYGSKVLVGGTSLQASKDGNLWTIDGIDYQKFRLFQLSILWRASVSKQQFFSYVQLGIHAEKIRQMLVAGMACQPGFYSCVMFGLKFGPAAATDLMVQPKRIRILDKVGYSFVFGGFLWLYIVARQQLTGQALQTVLSEEGRTVILVKNAMEMQSLKAFTDELFRLGRVP